MPVPQDLLDLLQGLQSDADDTALKTSAKGSADDAASAAATAAANAGHDLDASKAKQAADLQAAVAKLTSTYGQ